MKVKINTKVDLSNPAQVAALNAFLLALGANSSAPLLSSSDAIPRQAEEKPKPVRKRTRRTKAQIEADKMEAAAAKKLEDELSAHADAEAEAMKSTEDTVAKTEPETEEPKHTIAQVRKALQEKLDNHRKDIKAKLKELKAKNVSTMKPEHYDAFMEFLGTLS